MLCVIDGLYWCARQKCWHLASKYAAQTGITYRLRLHLVFTPALGSSSK